MQLYLLLYPAKQRKANTNLESINLPEKLDLVRPTSPRPPGVLGVRWQVHCQRGVEELPRCPEFSEYERVYGERGVGVRKFETMNINPGLNL